MTLSPDNEKYVYFAFTHPNSDQAQIDQVELSDPERDINRFSVPRSRLSELIELLKATNGQIPPELQDVIKPILPK